MNRRTKVILAVVLCVIPIVAVFAAWSQPVIRRHQTFDTSQSYDGILAINVSMPWWVYDECKVDVEVTDYFGSILGATVSIRSTENDILETIPVLDTGNYTTNWIPTQGDITILITAPLYGSLEGEIWVWARHSYFRIWYGE
jgi:hypothetical protein